MDILRNVIVIACGSRAWSDRAAVVAALEHLRRRGEPMTVVEGGCRIGTKGADRFAGQWAARMRAEGVGWVRVDAAWTVHDREGSGPVPCRCAPGKERCNAAGPRRNQAMLDYLLDGRAMGQTVGVVAFSHDLASSRGTGDMVRRARAAGVGVKVFGGLGWRSEGGR